MASVLSVSRQQPTLVKCSKMARSFEKLILVVRNTQNLLTITHHYRGRTKLLGNF